MNPETIEKIRKGNQEAWQRKREERQRANYEDESYSPLVLARLSPAGFAQYTSNGRWQLKKFLAILAGFILETVSTLDGRLIVEIPPRHGKSELISKHTPPWYLGIFPDNQVILSSYEADFAASWGGKARDLMMVHGPNVFGVSIKDTPASANHWEIKDHDGAMFTAGVGGPITGKGANLFIIDDPIKNAEEAASRTLRDKQWDWFQSTVYTRLQPGGCIILMMARWNEDDLAGRLQSEARKGGEPWTVVRMPAIGDGNPDDPTHRRLGEPLWEERYNKDRLAVIRRTLGPYWWSALMQQKPTPTGGTLIKGEWWQYYEELPEEGIGRTFISWDTAYKTGRTNDFSVGAVWTETRDGYYARELTRDRMELPTLVKEVFRMHEKYPEALHLVEDSASGAMLVQAIRAIEAQSENVRVQIPIELVQVSTDKITRASLVTGPIEAGQCFLPRHAEWVPEFIEEHSQFPNAAFDDQVDTTSLVLAKLIRSMIIATGSVYSEPKDGSWSTGESRHWGKAWHS